MPTLEVPVTGAFEIYTEVLALAARDMRYLREHPTTPKLYASGVRYQKGPEWSTIPAVLRRGWADCKVLCAWRIAELRLQGIKATPRVVLQRRGNPEVWHVLVRLPDRRIEDPSKRLGMGKNR